MPKRSAPSATMGPRPDVIVDFHCSQGMLFISLKNIGQCSAYSVCTVFDKPLVGLGGKKRISELQLFRRVEFVPPGKEFSQLVDPVLAWFKQEHPLQYSISINYDDRDGHHFQERIIHNLEIYKDLGNILISGGDYGQSAS
jgi:hypothetical protein